MVIASATTPPAKTTGKATPAPSAPQRALAKLGLVRDVDLALHLPLRYEDETQVAAIGGLRDGQTVQVEGVVLEAHVELRRRRQLLVRIGDGSGELTLRFLHFYPSHQKSLAAGRRVRVRGEVRGGFVGQEMVHPAFKAVEPGAPLAAALTPVYPTTAQLPQAYLRRAVLAALDRAPLAEVLPDGVVPAGLPTLRAALEYLHRPPPDAPLASLEDRSHPAWERLKFEELLAQQLSRRRAQRERAALAAPALPARQGGLHEQLLAALPFTLTAAQRRVADEIATDLARPQPMHRLLQGDVGSGKTVVAALAAALAIDAGWQCALMAPTEILAEQHFRKLVHWLEPLGVGLAWLVGGRRGKARTQALEQAASGAAGLVIGTHAVIQDDVAFARLGLAVVDEQHRFGVAQRLALRRKLDAQALESTTGRSRVDSPPSGGPTRSGGSGGFLEPHLLMMSATPIPRTLAMTAFADLDVSTIDALPPGRTPVATRVFADNRRDDVIDRIRDAVDRGRQVYWVCPLVEESEALDLRDATETHRQLCAALPGRRVGLIHGKLPAAEKAAVMHLFTGGRLQVLVATTVIEVGVDVPSASLMVVEHAERFGLAQLHQLRGRVGRGVVASVCVLLYTPPLSPSAKDRLKAMAETNDGFEIARRDLAIRGPGEFLGARQSGDALLRFADLDADSGLLAHAHRVAGSLLEQHPEAAASQVDRWLATRADYLKA